jgi:putative transposase
MIRDDDDFRAHVHYVHFNPVKHGLVADPGDWPYSTFHRALARGQVPARWPAMSAEGQEYGERNPAS